MEFNHEQGPALHTRSMIAVSAAAIDSALAELVQRMEAEIAEYGVITSDSARELRSLRVGAEQVLAVRSDASLAI